LLQYRGLPRWFSDKYITSFPATKILILEHGKAVLFLQTLVDEKLQNNSANSIPEEGGWGG
jgi:hypothetical protein